jgi:hypothetical protein
MMGFEPTTFCMASAHRFHQALGESEPFETPEEFQKWVRQHEHQMTAQIVTSGTKPPQGAGPGSDSPVDQSGRGRMSD